MPQIASLTVSSPAIGGEFIPKKYTCDGENISPPLTFKNIPAAAKTLVLILDDPDAPMGTFTHWVIFNINPQTREIKENRTPEKAEIGINDAGKYGYIGPCPPSGIHRYHFKLYALDTFLNLPHGADREQVEKAMTEHVLGNGEMVKTYEKQ